MNRTRKLARIAGIVIGAVMFGAGMLGIVSEANAGTWTSSTVDVSEALATVPVVQVYGSPDGPNWGIEFGQLFGFELKGYPGFFLCTDQC
jgi:hypothetical protein